MTSATPAAEWPSRTESADTPAARDRILAAAREEFSERGYDKTSVRGIAKAAGVDSALVHHYFGTKDQVFEAAITLSFAPAMDAPRMVEEGPLDGVGERLARFFFSVWENPATRVPLLAIVRSAVNNEAAAAVFRRIVATQVLRRIMRPPGRPGRGTAGRAGRRPAGGDCDAPVRDQGRAAGVGGPRADHRESGARGAGPPHRARSSGARGCIDVRSTASADRSPPDPQPKTETLIPHYGQAVQPLEQRAYARLSQKSLIAVSEGASAMPQLRSRTVTHGRNMAGARALMRASGVPGADIGRKPIIAVANSFTEFVPGHTHLQPVGRIVSEAIREAGGIPREFNTIAVDDGIAMGHGGMLYSLPSRDLIADSVEYMVEAHCADALICISNCDKITPGMLNAALRLNIPTVFVSGGPMESGRATLVDGTVRTLDLVDAISDAVNDKISDEDILRIEENACPTCGSCSGMFTANSMNCLAEAIGLALPGNGSVLATHTARRALYENAGRTVMDITRRYYDQDDETVLPRNVATFAAFQNAMALDIAMGGSTNTILHLLAAAQEAGVPFDLDDINEVSRRVPCLAKVAPNVAKDRTYYMEDVHRVRRHPRPPR